MERLKQGIAKLYEGYMLLVIMFIYAIIPSITIWIVTADAYNPNGLYYRIINWIEKMADENFILMLMTIFLVTYAVAILTILFGSYLNEKLRDLVMRWKNHEEDMGE